MNLAAFRARDVVRDLVILVVAKAVIEAWLLARGFSHVSDDDFSRVVIAEQFAHAPTLDPSGTSWLPFPFWITGSAMMIFGRSLATARAVAMVLGCLAPCLVYAALRVTRVKHPTFIALCTTIGPWAAWLSVATVPELPTAVLASSAVIVLTRDAELARVDAWFSACIFAACLSRYEAWPMAAACAIAIAFRATKYGVSRVGGAALALSVSAPLLWMMWNLHAHGDAFHFFARVSRFREHAGASASFAANLAFYPRAFASDAIDTALFFLFIVLAWRHREFRARWTAPLLACAATLAFLVIGAIKDGAPTHHPARALVIVFPIIVAASLASFDTLRLPREKARFDVAQGMALLLTVVAWNMSERPATSAAENRNAQITRGNELREAHASHVTLRPCAYEHFAVIAAFGAPERVNMVDPTSRSTPNDSCPAVEIDSM